MQLLIVRHAVAEERETFAATGRDDAERPLTEQGRRKFRKSALGLRGLVPALDVLATSALVRAVQTADILAKVYGVGDVVRLRELEPEARPAALLPWLQAQRHRAVVAVVGHEPHLSSLAERLLTGGGGREFVELKKGGACLVDLGEDPRSGRAALLWLLTPRQLRKLGG
jgi:phosphohistidine phosphatase